MKGRSIPLVSKVQNTLHPTIKLFHSQSHSPSLLIALTYTFVANAMPLDDQASKTLSKEGMDDDGAEESTAASPPTVHRFYSIPQYFPPGYQGSPLPQSQDHSSVSSQVQGSSLSQDMSPVSQSSDAAKHKSHVQGLNWEWLSQAGVEYVHQLYVHSLWFLSDEQAYLLSLNKYINWAHFVRSPVSASNYAEPQNYSSFS